MGAPHWFLAKPKTIVAGGSREMPWWEQSPRFFFFFFCIKHANTVIVRVNIGQTLNNVILTFFAVRKK